VSDIAIVPTRYWFVFTSVVTISNVSCITKDKHQNDNIETTDNYKTLINNKNDNVAFNIVW